MPNKLPAIIAAVSTFLLLLAAAFLFFFVQIIALNGVMSENKALASLGIGVICQGISMLLAAGLAGWLSHWAISKLNWNKALAMIVAVLLGVVVGLGMSLLSTGVSIPIAGIQ
jgi:hypothetical protein